MECFKLEFDSAPVVESEDTEVVPRFRCASCGLMSLAFKDMFLVPEDEIKQLHLESYDGASELPWMFEAAGMLVAHKAIADLFAREKISGYELAPATITNLDSGHFIEDFLWLKIYGKCNISPIWERVLSVCENCGMQKTERVTATKRIIKVIAPLPETDVFRGRERCSGILVNERIHDILIRLKSNRLSALKFRNVEVETSI